MLRISIATGTGGPVLLRTLIRFTAAAAAAIMLMATPAPAAPVEIQWWHAMPGELGRQLDKIAGDFNASQSEYRIVPTYKGLYAETMTVALFTFRARQHPAIVQVADFGTANMMSAKGAVYPVHQLMRDEGVPFDPAAYLPAVTGYYTDSDGNMLSFPFNSSTPILYYNKDQFRVAGLDPAVAPRTWPEVEAAARKLLAAGIACGFTTEWPSWINVENFSAVHDVPIATKANGFGGLDAELTINNPLLVRHIGKLAEWEKTRIFDYRGRNIHAERRFYGSDCGMFLGSSAARADILANAKFEVGYGMLPYWPDVAGAPHNSIIGGATLWVMNERPRAEYRGVARFFAFLSRPDVQAWWHQATGYLPITTAAYELTRAQGYYDSNPGTDISIKQITLKKPTANSRGMRLGSFAVIRDIVEQELEQALSGNKSAKDALDSAVARGNDVLRKFEQANR
jgi:sn-glycerol 3-phosphate transport system substrate-binding protein